MSLDPPVILDRPGADDPTWYKDAIFYELRIRSFFDSDADGSGDLRGATEKLDYLADLGVTTLWILPFYPSPLRDDGYDISDYMEVHPDVGTLADFRTFLREAHRRGLRVVTELVMNHTSDQHPWFQAARRAKPGTPARDFYVWSDSAEKWPEARIIFKDFEPSNWSWDPVARAYYWHRFFSHQPDLNYENPAVRKAMRKVLDFWLDMGVDGLRLDAIPYLFEREGTNCENLPETHALLKDMRRHVDARHPNRMLLAEANQWPEDSAAYFGDGDECHVAFHFPIMPRLFMAVQMEDRHPITDILAQTPEIPETAQWAMFLRNHDELTLEMVTDEERDYMYRMYAQELKARVNLGIRRRLAPLLGNDRRKIELMNALLFSLPGTPVLYYGDEIGMGDNFFLGDRNGVRTPMQWSSDRNAGFSRATPHRLFLPVIIEPEYHYESVNVESQEANPHSLLWWMKRLIGLRKRYAAFGRGTMEMLAPRNPRVLAFVRQHGDERILVVANLSRFVQYVELDLAAYRGLSPVELFSQAEFPPVGAQPYFLTLGPRAFYWFSLQPARSATIRRRAEAVEAPHLKVQGPWKELLEDDAGRARLAAALETHLAHRRWFAGKALHVRRVSLREAVPLAEGGDGDAVLLLVDVDYSDAPAETYAIPLLHASADRAQRACGQATHCVVARISSRQARAAREGVLLDALFDQQTCAHLLDLIAKRRSLRGERGELVAGRTNAFARLRGAPEPLTAAVGTAEQSNSSVIFGERLVLKFFRRLEGGTNPDLEIGLFLTEKARFPHVAPVAGFLEYRQPRREPITVGILQAFVPNSGDAWRMTQDALGHFFDLALTRRDERPPAPPRPAHAIVADEPPEPLREMMGAHPAAARLLAQRTAGLHRALSSDRDDPAFAPEPFTTLYQRSVYQSTRNLTSRTLRLLAERLDSVPEDVREQAARVLGLERRLEQVFKAIVGRRIEATRIRIHGDYHLGQVLNTGRDFVIIDFEGEPARPLGERRIKRSPLRDVAGMIRSLHYASWFHLHGPDAVERPEDVPLLEPWGRAWSGWASAVFLHSYVEASEGGGWLPARAEDTALLLRHFLLEKAVYELGYELNNRPEWIRIPIAGILELLEEDA